MPLLPRIGDEVEGEDDGEEGKRSEATLVVESSRSAALLMLAGLEAGAVYAEMSRSWR